MQQVQDTLPIGSVIHGSSRDRYIVESVLGRGGFSTIYLVKDQRAEQNLYALKEVRDPDRREASHVAFEYKILTRIEHASLPRVYRVFENMMGNRIYILMDYIKGLNLEQLRKRSAEGRITLTRACHIMDPIVQAISFLHNQEPPIVHRDIKPSNIIVPTSGEQAYLVDFGTAKEYASDTTTTAVSHCTPGYAAPEQYSVGTAPGTDIYGLGATFYTLLTGKVPADALQRLIQLSEKGIDPLEPVDKLVPTLSPAIDAVIQQAMALRRADRFETVDEFWEALSSKMELEDMDEPITTLPLVPNSPTAIESTESTENTENVARRTRVLPESNMLHPFSLNKRVRMSILPLLLLVIVLLVGASIEGASRPFALVLKNVHSSSTPVQVHPTSTSSFRSTMPYPPLAEHYRGTISDNVSNSTTAMSLTNIQQQKDTIQGDFVGLGLTGTFVGKINASGHMEFQVAIYGGNETLALEGDVKPAGSLAGSYRILNHNSEFTGEYGLWSVSPS